MTDINLPTNAQIHALLKEKLRAFIADKMPTRELIDGVLNASDNYTIGVFDLEFDEDAGELYFFVDRAMSDGELVSSHDYQRGLAVYLSVPVLRDLAGEYRDCERRDAVKQKLEDDYKALLERVLIEFDSDSYQEELRERAEKIGDLLREDFEFLTSVAHAIMIYDAERERKSSTAH